MALVGTLDECVRRLLCALGDALLAPLKALLISQLAILNGLLAQARIVLTSLEVVTLPLQTVKDTADAGIELVRGQLLALPSLEGCLDLSALGELLSGFADDVTAPIQAKIDQINALLAERRRIEAYITKLETDIASIEAVIAEISACGPSETGAQS